MYDMVKALIIKLTYKTLYSTTKDGLKALYTHKAGIERKKMIVNPVISRDTVLT